MQLGSRAGICLRTPRGLGGGIQEKVVWPYLKNQVWAYQVWDNAGFFWGISKENSSTPNVFGPHIEPKIVAKPIPRTPAPAKGHPTRRNVLQIPFLKISCILFLPVEDGWFFFWEKLWCAKKKHGGPARLQILHFLQPRAPDGDCYSNVQVRIQLGIWSVIFILTYQVM